MDRAAIPAGWLDALELRTEIKPLAAYLRRGFHGGELSIDATWDRYPAW